MGLEHQGQHQHGHSGRARRGAAEEQSKQLLLHHCCFRRRLMAALRGLWSRLLGVEILGLSLLEIRYPGMGICSDGMGRLELGDT